ncbi:hypothetical protein FNO01nite_15050 [Flavobacterium noncentrifugens]|uniref:AraC family transcriptional regulator n=1 Tax=Flavobacterium noncentrifugens TaxID=1128970 RepID=A0A1G8WBG0_9FLAO|nr:GyrI-like domain-containing protein [Flavobacterium noncentrifugens]GEP50833.1 hypothetical protein FNO01nite_15050 [Flavobacterium noncentrifugens]SDJ75095.1 AraC family transcriptional regulator [Flavobacterium noncentrifugens]
MEPKIENASAKIFIGFRMKMSLTNNQTFTLWNAFMKRQKEIKNRISSDLFSLQCYQEGYFNHFNPANEFEKWAAVEVDAVASVPENMETLRLAAGNYAVFTHIGGAETAAKTFQYIFQQWLPQSEYDLDNRPHFEILGDKYKKGSPDSEEEIWIPIQPKLKN